MLDADTKRRIDNCRDILVGKVPDPKSQVEQITIALIYKFMDDMDAEAEELGGVRTFFAGAFARFSWSQLMALSLSGFEVLNLYSEAIQSMRENPGVPELFRDIFKNAYLPYRDPETLKSFLKEINGFTYDHSERLGDAFEYLLSVLGSQGDAGQFRTPRNIIDFMVAVLDPQKNDTILDPACGTAGFLISAWKHILKANTSPDSKIPGDRLTPEERARLASGIKGYDISPDMVRLSLVNLYLHGFADPHVVEYDTLTQDDKWNELADVILANPPFMSPKGGIKPHKRFSVQATRSEVLFVDYMAEHLTATGRAAIVVPEGIIFQSGTAYKALRKMLVESCLVAVVSLPAGVFNPYSGVKTSILILDKRLHKQTDSVLFVKVQNDGFNLGAQRRAVAGNDLPEATRLLRGWIAASQAFESGGGMAQVVARSLVGGSEDFNLSGERYVAAVVQNTEYELVRLRDVCEVNPRKSELDTLPDQTRVSFVPMKDLAENSSNFVPQEERLLEELRQGAYTYFRDGDVLVAKVTPCFENGKAGIARNLLNGVGFGSSEYYVLRPSARLLPELLYYFMTSSHFKAVAVPAMTGTGGLQRVPKSLVEDFTLPLPHLDVQRQIVSEIEGYQKVIDGARQVLEGYRPSVFIDSGWPVERLGDIFQTKSGTTPARDTPAYFEGGHIHWVKTLDLNDGGVVTTDECVTDLALAETHLDLLPIGTVLVAMYGGFKQIGRTGVLEIEATCNQAMTALLPSPRVDPYYLNVVLISQRDHWKSVANSTRKDPNITKSDVLNFKLPLPDLEVQRAIVAEIKAEQALVNANRDLIRRMEAKIKAAIDRVWGAGD
ncbi:MAG: N-6 DNA methylase [Hydrogenophaga sp.]|nr:N-6 DNA methylase [Hydrogenophaga sp.]